MAIIPIQHVIADNLPVDPDWSFAINGTIQAGTAVDIGTGGFVRLVNVAGARALGLAGDNLMNAGGGTPYSTALTVGAGGNRTRSTENRVSDFFDETLASSLLTVYHGGGRFASDQTVAGLTFTPGDLLYASAVGTISNVAGAGIVLGVCIAAPGAYPSGVPGTDVSGSITLGDYIDMWLVV